MVEKQLCQMDRRLRKAERIPLPGRGNSGGVTNGSFIHSVNQIGAIIDGLDNPNLVFLEYLLHITLPARPVVQEVRRHLPTVKSRLQSPDCYEHTPYFLDALRR